MVEIALDSFFEILPFVIYTFVLALLFVFVYTVGFVITYAFWYIESKLDISANAKLDKMEIDAEHEVNQYERELKND